MQLTFREEWNDERLIFNDMEGKLVPESMKTIFNELFSNEIMLNLTQLKNY